MTYPQPPEITPNPCDQAQETLFSLQEAEPVSAEAQTFLQTHLSQCQPCQSYQQSLAHLVASLSDLEPVPVPDGLADRILAHIAVESESTPTGVLLRPQPSAWKKYSAVAAAILMVAVAVPLLMPNGPQNLNVGSSLAQKTNIAPVAKQAAVGGEDSAVLNSKIPSESLEGAQLAFAGSTGVGLKQTYASETESDMYYDPVSTLVGF